MDRATPLAMLALVALCACDSETEGSASTDENSSSLPPTSSSAFPQQSKPARLYLPDAGDEAITGTPPAAAHRIPLKSSGRCPAEMADIRGAFCIDRYEVSLRDATQDRSVSPYYFPSLSRSSATYERWSALAPRTGTTLARATPIPPPPAWQLEGEFEVMAVSLPSVIPNGYLNAQIAESACRAAGKRLCRPGEWLTACRGEAGWRFPYGDEYSEGSCNIHRDTHPARLLHSRASRHHTDPRLNTVEDAKGPLLAKTGTYLECASRWGGDAVFDMVGNLDEWVHDASGVFMGGFYARGTKSGCDAKVTAHDASYYDYSLGARCCL